MENTFFVFAPDEGYLFNSPKRLKGGNLRKELRDYLDEQDTSSMLWGAFGPGEENCFFAWQDSAGALQSCVGDDTPPALKEWLIQTKIDEHIKVSLGPDGSFFAWDSKHIVWQGVPDGLQKVVLGWLSPTGWAFGPPRIVTLGARGSWFALSEYGSSGFSIDPNLKPATKGFTDLEDEVARGVFSYSELEYVNLSSCDDEHYVLVKKSRDYAGDIPDSSFGAFLDCVEDLLDGQVLADFQAGRKAKQEREAREAKEAKAKKEKEHREAKEAQARREQREREAEELTLQYVLWQTAWEADIARKKVLTTFPHLPVRVCTCKEVSCSLRKIESGLLACQHDVERFLRASDMYSIAWLKKQRLPWHPDRFGLRCDPDFRRDLKKKATEMYAIFETLIAQEQGGHDD